MVGDSIAADGVCYHSDSRLPCRWVRHVPDSPGERSVILLGLSSYPWSGDKKGRPMPPLWFSFSFCFLGFGGFTVWRC